MPLPSVCHLSGRARLRFTRQPYSHWSFTFYSEPSLELQVDSQFQGRPVPHITSLITSQVCHIVFCVKKNYSKFCMRRYVKQSRRNTPFLSLNCGTNHSSKDLCFLRPCLTENLISLISHQFLLVCSKYPL